MSTSDSTNGHSAVQKAPLKFTTVAVTIAVLGACATPAPPLPPPPPPPPPPVQTTPYRPLPPGGAAYVMKIPGKNAMGQRQTINLGLTEDERVWHFRSAWNVAALNCTTAQYAPITTAYSAYISDHATALKRVNDRLERGYRNQMGARRAGILAREEQMTAVYNFFALPPARAGFCRAALDISNRYQLAPVDPIAFANDNFPLIEQPFETFFQEYEQYQRDSALWDAEYGAMFGPSQPGWVAVQEARAQGIEVPTAGASDPTATLAAPAATAGTMTDPETGAAVPVVPVQENVVSQPVVEPVATDTSDGNSSSPQ